MLQITESLVGGYLDVMAIVTILGLVIISKRLRSLHTPGDRIFLIMCISVIGYALLSILIMYVPFVTKEQYSLCLIVIKTVIELIILYMGYQWVMFVGYSIYKSVDFLRRKFWPLFIPLPFCALLFIINIFTGILFTLDSHYSFRFEPGYFVIVAIEVLYFGVSAWIVRRNNKNADSVHRFHIAPIIIPIVAGIIENVFAQISVGPIGFSVGPMGFAAGITFVLFMMTERWQYDDEERGFFNKAYIEYLTELSRKGKKDYKSVILLKSTGGDSELAEVIRNELPKDVERVHFGHGSFGLFCENDSKAMFEMMKQVLTDAALDYDKRNPDAPINLNVTREKRGKDEGSVEFLVRMGA